MYKEAQTINRIVKDAQKIIIIQADNPDADSLGSALALESILGGDGKDIYLYCAVDIPAYLRYMKGWDRVQNELPKQFDASIIVDASTMTLLEKLTDSGQQGWLAGKPCVVIDHHRTVEKIVPFADIILNDPSRASAGEIIYMISRQLEWPMPKEALESIMTSILGDTQGLTNQLASAETYRIMAEMLDVGVNRTELEESRREFSKMPREIYGYKADLIKRTEFAAAGQIAAVVIPQNEINEFSPLYNPAPLIQNDMLQTSGVMVAIVFKTYADGKITGAIRCNLSAPVGGKLAEKLGGGGHDFASGFKITDGRKIDEIKDMAFTYTAKLLQEISA